MYCLLALLACLLRAREGKAEYTGLVVGVFLERVFREGDIQFGGNVLFSLRPPTYSCESEQSGDMDRLAREGRMGST